MFSSDFHVSASRSCSVSMMYQETKFRYGKFLDDQVQVLEMPYRGDDITMVLVLPSRDGSLSQVGAVSVVHAELQGKDADEVFLSKVEESLQLQKLTGWLQDLKETTVSVHLPRFTVEDGFSLKEKLEAMGLRDLFSPEKASLPGAATLEPSRLTVHRPPLNKDANIPSSSV